MNIDITVSDIRFKVGTNAPPSLEHGEPGFASDDTLYVGDATKTPVAFESSASIRSYVDAATSAARPTIIDGGTC